MEREGAVDREIKREYKVMDRITHEKSHDRNNYKITQFTIMKTLHIIIILLKQRSDFTLYGKKTMLSL